MPQLSISQQWDPLCDQCKSMTSTLRGLKALISRRGSIHYEFKSPRHSECPFCQLLDEERSTDDPPLIQVFAQLVPQETELDILNQVYGNSSGQHPLQNHRIQFFYTKQVDYSLAIRLGIRKVAELENALCDEDGEELLQKILKVDESSSIEGLELASTYDCFTTQDDSARELVGSTPLNLDEKMKSVLAEVKKRIKSCTKHHKRCGTGDISILPKRLIDVGTEASGTNPKLYCSQHNEQSAYIALSYCWGGPQECSLTKDTMEEFTQAIPLTSLSQSIKDAIKITRTLGYRYLWVDVLCIIQDNTEDKISEINLMGSIYKNATLTIGAGTSLTASDGFLRSFPIFVPCRMPLLLPTGDLGTIWLQAKAKHERFTDTSDTPLQSRGWTLQEFLLSPRVLYFNSCDLIWHCQTNNCTMDLGTITSYEPTPNYNNKPLLPKCLPPGVFQDLNTFGKMPSKAVAKLWNAVVTEYSGRKFTNEVDRLPALADIAGEFQKISQDIYLAGMWKNWLFQQLGWYSYERLSSVNIPTQSPTWSWATFPHEVMFDEVEEEDAKLDSCSTTLGSENAQLGAVIDGRLVLIATAIPNYAVTQGRSRMDIRMNYGLEKAELSHDILWVLLGYKSRGNSVGLIIRPSFDGNFVRIGQVKIARKSTVWESKAAERKVITII